MAANADKQNPNSREFAELANHLAGTTSLSVKEAERVTAEVIGFFNETVEEFVRRKHHELKLDGQRNEAAFAVIQSALPERRFRAQEKTVRQLRRIIYS